MITLTVVATATPTLTLQHEEIQPGETVLGTITTTGEFTNQIEKSDIKFYKGRKEVFFEYGIMFYGGTHYFYAYTTTEGNFTIEISNILYKEADILQSATITKNISIIKVPIFDEEQNTTIEQILAIKPGFIYSYTKPTIKLINKANYQLNLTYQETEISILPFETKEIYIEPTTIFTDFEISTYKEFTIPVVYILNNDTIIIPLDADLKSEPNSVLTNLIEGEESSKILTLYNSGDDELTNITFSSNLDFIKFSELNSIEARETKNLTLTFNAEEPGYYQDNLLVSYIQNEEKFSIIIPLNLFVLPPGSTEEDFIISEETCEEKGGIVCTAQETCDGQATFTKGGIYCCLSTCSAKKTESSSSYGVIIGIIIFLALAVGGYMLYKRSKKVKQKSPQEKLAESTKNYSKRISGGLERG